MKKVILPLIVFLVFSAPVLADPLSEMASCALFSDNDKRLICYDKILKKNNILIAGSQKNDGVSVQGNWIVTTDTNPIDDSKTVVAYLKARSGENSSQVPTLVLRCMSNKTESMIEWNDFLSTEYQYVTTRVGSKKAVTEPWSLSTDKTSTFHTEPIAFIRSMLKESRLLAQTTPYNENPVTAIFDISGIDNALTEVRKTCIW
jgi:type VI secretion system protein VasI